MMATMMIHLSTNTAQLMPKIMRWVYLSPLAIIIFFTEAQPALAWSSNPPSAVLATLPEAQRVGGGTLRWLGLKIYDGQLWTNVNQKPLDYKTHGVWLELRYARGFSGSDIAKRSIKEIKHIGQMPPGIEHNWLQALENIIPSVKQGDTLGALRIPQKGLVLYRNGEPIGTLNDEALATAFIGIWLDAKTSAPEMRNQLLGLSKQ